jgi:hypothetical protein
MFDAEVGCFSQPSAAERLMTANGWARSAIVKGALEFDLASSLSGRGCRCVCLGVKRRASDPGDQLFFGEVPAELLGRAEYPTLFVAGELILTPEPRNKISAAKDHSMPEADAAVHERNLRRGCATTSEQWGAPVARTGALRPCFHYAGPQPPGGRKTGGAAALGGGA